MMAWEIKRYSDGTEILKEVGPMGRFLFSVEERPGLGIDAAGIRSTMVAAPDMLAALKALAGPMEAVRDDMASLGIQFPLSHAARAERTRLLVDWIKANADAVDDALDLAFAAIAKAEGRA